jgi:hypothetical protein
MILGVAQNYRLKPLGEKGSVFKTLSRFFIKYRAVAVLC